MIISGSILISPVFSLAKDHPFEGEIRAFEKLDVLRPPVKHAILFVGSSSIKYWKTLDEDFANYSVLNRGFGGSQFRDLLHFFDRIVVPYQPSAIVIYSGSHDLHQGKRTPGEVQKMVQTFHDRVQAKLPGTKVFFISLKPSIAKWENIALDQETNRLVAEYAAGTDTMEYIDIWTPMVEEGSPPPERYYVADLNHLSREGYHLWASIIRGHLEKNKIPSGP